jgi:hypothetical protein
VCRAEVQFVILARLQAWHVRDLDEVVAERLHDDMEVKYWEYLVESTSPAERFGNYRGDTYLEG